MYDAATNQTVMFGGAGAKGRLNDTWVWDGSNWTQTLPTHNPPARTHFAMSYDAIHRQIVIFGGQGAKGSIERHLGMGWQQLNPKNAGDQPFRSVFITMAAYGADQRLVMFGGAGTPNFSLILGDTWLWDGNNWPQDLTA